MKIFVMMPFADEFRVIRDPIRQAAEIAQVECVWADEIWAAGQVTEQIMQAIRASSACIADLTGHNPNVACEIGYALALGKPLITVAEDRTSLFFDLRHQRTLFYKREDLPQFRQRLVLSLRELTSTMAGPEDLIGTSGHETTSLVLASKRIADTPYVFANLIARARRHIFLAAQNHHFFIQSPLHQQQFKSDLLTFMKGHPSRQVDIMLCDLANDSAIQTWQYVTAKEYREHLLEASNFFDHVAEWAIKNEVGNQLKIARVMFVPFSVTFVDPDSPDGILAFTPNAYEEKSRSRPCFVLSKQKNSEIFSEYWDSFYQRFENPNRV